MARRYDVPVDSLTIQDDAATRARGEHIVRSLAKCVDCHGDDLGGKVMVDDTMVGTLAGPNLTSAGLGAKLSTDDWVRAITHGVGHDRRPLTAMPAADYNALGRDDVAAIVAYARSVPPVTRELPPPRLGPVIRVMMTVGSVQLLEAEKIDHSRPLGDSPRPDANPIYGEYLARTGGCFGCHGPNLAGGPIPGMPPGTPNASDIRRDGAIAKWSEEDFTRALRQGRRPDGTELRAPMPWRATAQMTDVEMKALYLYLERPTDQAKLSQR
jgi:mono/diheme cytochrome c family protein